MKEKLKKKCGQYTVQEVEALLRQIRSVLVVYVLHLKAKKVITFYKMIFSRIPYYVVYNKCAEIILKYYHDINHYKDMSGKKFN